MARYQCPDCKYTYDETLGHPHEGFPAGTVWANVPDEWACPDCAVRDKVDFELIGGSPAATTSATQAVEVAAAAHSAVTVTDTAVIEKPASPMSEPAVRTTGVLRAVASAPEAMQSEAVVMDGKSPSAGCKPFAKWICITCGHIYDEALGDASDGFAAGTRFEDIPDDWCCPDCGATKKDYVLCQET
jgi:rubredoxin